MDNAVNAYKIEQGFKYVDEDWWKWWIWIEGSDSDLDKIHHVLYTLHFSFNDPVRKVDNRNSKFRLDTEGWGVFTLFGRLYLKDGMEVPLEHELVLEYPDGEKNLK